MTTPATTRLDAFSALGVPLLSTTDAEQALKAGGLFGWNVRKTDTFYSDPVTGEPVKMAKTNAVIYDQPGGGTGYLGTVGDRFRTMQNEEQLELLQIFVDEAGATFETAGQAYGGRLVFVTMKLPGVIKVGGVDPVDMYVASINAHDGNMSHNLIKTPLRFACMNMLNITRKNPDTAIFRTAHTRGARGYLEAKAHQMLDETFSYMDEFSEVAERLIQKSLTQSQFEQIVAKEFGAADDAAKAVQTRAENKLEKMFELFADAQTQEGIRGTAWAGFNTLAEWADHFSPVTGEDKARRRAVKSILEPAFKDRALGLMLAA